MQKYNGQLIRQFSSSVSGNAASGVTVTVRRQSDSGLATLYVDNNIAGATLSNPITSSATGHFAFYAPDDVYTLTFSDSTPVQVIQLQDVAELQAQFDAAVLNAGYIPSGTFTAGATLTQANQVLSDGSSYWRWDGGFPKVVAAGSEPTPTGVGNWIVLSDFALRGELADADSTVLVGGVDAGSIGQSYKRRVVFAPLLTSNTAAQNSAILQDKIDYANSLNSAVAGFGAGAVTVEIPAGSFDFEGAEIKKGVDIAGAGIGQTVLFLTGNNKTGFWNASRDTNSFAQQLSYGVLGKLSIAPKNPASTTGQIMLDLVGFSRYRFEDMFIGWCSGVTGLRMTGATIAGDGGPAQWYNTFVNLHVERPSGWPAGGTGWLLGDLAADKEQVTTWTIVGGRTSGSGSGTGINIQSCNTLMWLNHTIEGCDVLIGTDGAARFPVNVVFSPLYLEGDSGDQFRISSVAVDTAIFGQFITGYTVTDNSATTQRHAKDNFKSYSASSSLSEWLVNIQDGNIRRPTFKALSGFAGVDLTRTDGIELTLENASQTSSADSFFRVSWNNKANMLFSVGSSSLSCGTDGGVTVGTAANRFSVVYATTGTINTSDERYKTELMAADAAEKAAALEIKANIRKFKLLDSVESKGESARVHFGVGAQTVKLIMEKHGLTASDYGFFCFDEWGDVIEPAPTDDYPDAVIVRQVAGNRYGIRYEELAMFILGAI